VNIPALGVGVVYVAGLEPLLEPGVAPISLLEIEPSTFWRHHPTATSHYQIQEEALAEVAGFPQAKIVHGVGFPVGGSRRPDPSHLPLFKRVVDELDAPWASEHLGFNEAHVGGVDFNTRLFLPSLQTRAGVEAAVSTIQRTQEALQVPFAVETLVNYLQPYQSEISDGTFVSAVVEEADCGILLDLHNLYANERNGRQSVREYLSEIPLDRVWELHVAGGSSLNGYWLDAHSDLVPPEVMAMTADLVPELPNLGAIVFEILPTYVPRVGLKAIRKQLELLHEIWERRGSRASYRPTPTVKHKSIDLGDNQLPFSPQEWEDTLGILAVGWETRGDLASNLGQDKGLAIIRRLIWDFRAGDIAAVFPLTTRLLLLYLGEAKTRELLSEFFGAIPPQLFPSDEVMGFAEYLVTQSLEVPFLSQVVAYERAVVRSQVYDERETVRFPADPNEVLSAIARGRMPELPKEEEMYEVEVTP